MATSLATIAMGVATASAMLERSARLVLELEVATVYRLTGTKAKSSVASVAIVAVAALSSIATAQVPTSFAGALQELDGGHDRSVAAVQELRAGGEFAAITIRDAWPALSARAQKRALVALTSLAENHVPAVECLVEAAHAPDEEISGRALMALRRAGALGWDGLVTLLDDSDLGDRAAVLVARADPDAAIAPLLAAIGAESGDGRPVLRSALATTVRRADADVEPQLRAWLETQPSASAVANATLALVSVEEYAAVTATFIEYAAPKSEDFPTTWRLLQGAGGAGPSEVVDRWVRDQLQAPDEWMLRQAAIDALAARGLRTEARVALDDPYPRVRARAAGALSKDPESMVARATMARKDPWPMVRADAVTSLRSEPVATPVIVAAVDDSMSDVRAAAIEVLARVTHDEGWDRVHSHLRNRNEWPVVVAAAIDYVVAHCRTDAVDALFVVVRRAASPSALTDDVNNAARAITALRVLNTSETEEAVRQLRGAAGVPPTLKMALEEPLPKHHLCPE